MPELMPNAGKIEIKDGFRERYSALTDWEPFIQCSLSFLRRSIRVNTLKISVEDVKKRMSKDWHLEPIPWCKEGFFIDHKGEGEDYRRDVGNTMEHQLGYIYIQEAASMIPPLILEPQPGETILDMCASPGSKAGQIAQYMKNEGVLIANDFQGMRLAPLGINMQRMSATNCILTMMDGLRFREAGLLFDRILVDAPCSGTGTIRKSPKTLRIWNPAMVRKIANQQKRLIKTAFDILKSGGTMVYSTCSLEPEEDEAIVDWLLKECPEASLEHVELPGLKKGKIVTEFDGTSYSKEVEKCLRLWPQDNDTEGFFVAKIRKA